MDKQIRVSAECHEALKKFAEENRTTIRSAAAIASRSLTPYVVVASNKDGKHVIVESYTSTGVAQERYKELKGVFPGRFVSMSSRKALDDLHPLRIHGPEWVKATSNESTRPMCQEDLHRFRHA